MFDLLDFLAQLFVVVIGLSVLIVAVLYVIDRVQTRNAVRRNFPVIGRFRTIFERLGEFFRQYFFAMDREEMPFNRAERTWVYRAAKGEDTMAAFGSTRDMKPVGTVIFVNCPLSNLGAGLGADHRRADWPVLRPPAYRLIGIPHIRHELRRRFPAGREGVVQRRAHGGDLDEHRRRGALAHAPRGWSGHRLPDWHREVRCA